MKVMNQRQTTLYCESSRMQEKVTSENEVTKNSTQGDRDSPFE